MLLCVCPMGILVAIQFGDLLQIRHGSTIASNMMLLAKGV